MADDHISRKRRVPRREYFREVGLLHDGVYQVAEAREIGERGMLIASTKEIRDGSRVVITFQVPNLDLAVVRGIVRYRMEDDKVEGQFKFGVEFETIDFEFKRQIRHYVASTTKIQKKAS